MKRQISKHRSFDAWAESLPSQGRYTFTRREAMSALNLSHKAFNRVAGRMSSRKKLARIHGDFYVVVPLEHAAAGVLPADWFIVDLMKHLGRSFYVGGLNAAEYHGAAHQRPQNFQVVTDRPLRSIVCRGVGIRFFAKRDVAGTPLQQIKGVTGYIPVSTPEATAFDLLRYSRQIGGLNHVLTVLQELAEVIDQGKLVAAAEADGNVAYAQRLGWLLEKTEFSGKADKLAKWVKGRKPFLAKLEPALSVRGCKRDQRWMLLINTEVEGDLS
ncbi:MAG: type IV toxin-antitoxin system AbiEi family antitoxin [Lentisphaerae bacterium]|nr:type IV toxin-antitoxin system AbiEi family antitoxin [Lentisphaerota bacterium]